MLATYLIIACLMPEPQILDYGAAPDGRLRIDWLMAGIETRAFLVHTGQGPEFDVASSTLFVMPAATSSCALRVGAGSWYIRVGACVGSEEQGKVEWSITSGPIDVGGVGEAPMAGSGIGGHLNILHSKSVSDGMRFHTGRYDGYMVFFEVGPASDVGTTFPLGKTKWKWARDRGVGWVECWSLQYPETYSIRMRTFDGAAFPTSGVVIASVVKVFPRCGAARQMFHRDFEGRLNEKGDAALLLERKTLPTMKFASHGDYLRYQAAVVRSSDVKSQTVGPAYFPKDSMN